MTIYLTTAEEDESCNECQTRETPSITQVLLKSIVFRLCPKCTKKLVDLLLGIKSDTITTAIKEAHKEGHDNANVECPIDWERDWDQSDAKRNAEWIAKGMP